MHRRPKQKNGNAYFFYFIVLIITLVNLFFNELTVNILNNM